MSVVIANSGSALSRTRTAPGAFSPPLTKAKDHADPPLLHVCQVLRCRGRPGAQGGEVWGVGVQSLGIGVQDSAVTRHSMQ